MHDVLVLQQVNYSLLEGFKYCAPQLSLKTALLVTMALVRPPPPRPRCRAVRVRGQPRDRRVADVAGDARTNAPRPARGAD